LIGVIPKYNRFWFDGKPVNHDPSNLIGTQFLIPVYEEADFYFINMKSFKKYKTRVCGKIYNYEVSDIESVDIDTKYDLLIAKTVIEAMEKVYVV
jgi:CMP-N-acetylneuraminic acid synthetase